MITIKINYIVIIIKIKYIIIIFNKITVKKAKIFKSYITKIIFQIILVKLNIFKKLLIKLNKKKIKFLTRKVKNKFKILQKFKIYMKIKMILIKQKPLLVEK